MVSYNEDGNEDLKAQGSNGDVGGQWAFLRPALYLEE